MAVVFVTTSQVKPDGMEAMMDRARRAKAFVESVGGRNARALSGVAAGEATGTVTVTFEFDNFAQFGAVDKVLADPQMAEMMANTSDSPAAGWQGSLRMDVPF